MQSSIYQFAEDIFSQHDIINGADIVEAGALDVNGSLRPLVMARGQPRSYLATDMRDGPGVDVVCPAEDLVPLSADLVISTEMLEHAEDWRGAMMGMARAVRFGGHMLITTRSPGFPEHDHPHDYWRFEVHQIRLILLSSGFYSIRCRDDTDEHSPGVFAFGIKMVPSDLSEIEVSPVWLPG